MSNEKKSATLGMPHGTASNRLRKMLLFRQLQKCGDDICVRCKEHILNIDELSIEHIKPWEGISAELFWDLNNIAFSHMSCNLSARKMQTEQPLQRKIGPSGTSWCRVHKLFLPIEQFYKDPTKWDGLNSRCIGCHKARSR